MTRDELKSSFLFSGSQIMKHFHKATKPQVTIDPTFQTMSYGTIKTFFKERESDNDIRSSAYEVFHTLMIIPASCGCDSNPEHDIPVYQFYPDVSTNYVVKNNEYFIWD